jgi:hypothetical protein
MVRFITPALIIIVEINGVIAEVKAGQTAVVVFAYGLVAVCAILYFAFLRNSNTGTNADEVK